MKEIWFNKTIPHSTKYYFVVLIILILITVPLLFYKYENTKTIYGQINSDYNIVINVEEEVVPLLKKIKINNKLENIKIINISKEYVLDEKFNKYKVVTIKQNMKNQIINNLVKIDLILPKKNIIERIKIWN